MRLNLNLRWRSLGNMMKRLRREPEPEQEGGMNLMAHMQKAGSNGKSAMWTHAIIAQELEIERGRRLSRFVTFGSWETMP